MKTSNKKNRKQKRSPEISISVSILVFIALLGIMSLFSGCKAKEVIRYVPLVIRHDSIVEKTIRDTVRIYPPQKQNVKGVKKSHLETDLAKSDAFIDINGLLNHSIENKGTIPAQIIEIKTVVRDSVPYPVEVKVPGETVTKEVPVRGFYWWFGFSVFWCFILFLIYKLVTWSPVKSFIIKLLKFK